MNSTNLTGAQFRLIVPYLPKVKRTKPRIYSDFDLLNGVLYVLISGCQWRNIPTTYPKWSSCYKYFRKLVRSKYFDLILFKLNLKFDFNHILIVDSQSTKSTEFVNQTNVGYDGHKKVKGIKRFSLVDSQGHLWAIQSLPANTSEKDGLRRVIEKHRNTLPKQFKCILADKGFESQLLSRQLVKEGFTLYSMRSTKRLKRGTVWDFQQNNLHNYLNKQISKTRWVVERTFSWLLRCRRLVVNYERQLRNHEGFVKLAMIRLLIKKLV